MLFNSGSFLIFSHSGSVILCFFRNILPVLTERSAYYQCIEISMGKARGVLKIILKVFIFSVILSA